MNIYITYGYTAKLIATTLITFIGSTLENMYAGLRLYYRSSYLIYIKFDLIYGIKAFFFSLGQIWFKERLRSILDRNCGKLFPKILENFLEYLQAFM
jgi:hypothetical protein